MKIKDRPFELKAFDPDTGVFEGYAAVFGNKDSYGDVVVAGAFKESLEEDFGPGGSGVPCYWAHNFSDPFMNIGETISAVEDDYGLLVKVALDLTTNAGKRVHQLLVDGRVKQMSFGYEVLEAAFVESEELGFFYELRKMRLFEVSVVPIGANTATTILSAKSAEVQPVVDGLRTAQAAINAAYKALGIDPGTEVPQSAPEIPSPVEAAEAPAPEAPAADLAAGDPDSTSSDEEPDAANAEEPVPPANAEEPVAAKSRADGESAIARARAAMQLAGINP
ncbi:MULTISPECIES: HK97 family phage prohead protease [unclassified Microbacterium]|uniref:HK97 family phage prohead protease n=1 Tax=unclassified Microbacterium TaxID=2609290 RepID=UPI0034354F62